MMTDSTSQQHQAQSSEMDSDSKNSQQRQLNIQRILAKLPIHVSKQIEEAALKNAKGNQLLYIRYLEHYYQTFINVQRQQQQVKQQQQQQSVQMNINDSTYSTRSSGATTLTVQASNIPGQPPTSLNSMLSQPISIPLNPQQSRLLHSSQNALHSQSGTLNSHTTALSNATTRSREQSSFQRGSSNASTYTSMPSQKIMTNSNPIQKNDSTQSYSNNQSHVNANNTNPSPTPLYQTNQNQNGGLTVRAQTMNLSGPFSSTTLLHSSNNDEIRSQNNVANSLMKTTSLTSPIVRHTNSNTNPGDNLLHRILSTNDSNHNRMTTNRSMPIRSATPTTGTSLISPSNTSSKLRPVVSSVNSRTSITMNTSNPNMSPTSNGTLLSSNLSGSVQQTLINQPNSVSSNPVNVPNTNHNGFTVNKQSTVTLTSTPINNQQYSQTTTRLPSTNPTGPISNPSEEILSLIKSLKENVAKLQAAAQKYKDAGNLKKSREIENYFHLAVQFITNPTYEVLPTARYLYQVFGHPSSRNQTTPISISKSDFAQWEQAFKEFLSVDHKKRTLLTTLFTEPLTDVLNGVPHKKMRLDIDGSSHSMINRESLSSFRSLQSRIDHELDRLPSEVFLIERTSSNQKFESNDDSSNKNEFILRCTLIESSKPIVPPLRLRISSNYPDEQPEILSLTNTKPPKLDFTDNHPFLEQVSTTFIFHLFQSSRNYRITDILDIWRRSVESAH